MVPENKNIQYDLLAELVNLEKLICTDYRSGYNTGIYI